jgi:hypothetical protein
VVTDRGGHPADQYPGIGRQGLEHRVKGGEVEQETAPLGRALRRLEEALLLRGSGLALETAVQDLSKLPFVHAYLCAFWGALDIAGDPSTQAFRISRIRESVWRIAGAWSPKSSAIRVESRPR